MIIRNYSWLRFKFNQEQAGYLLIWIIFLSSVLLRYTKLWLRIIASFWSSYEGAYIFYPMGVSATIIFFLIQNVLIMIIIYTLIRTRRGNKHTNNIDNKNPQWFGITINEQMDRVLSIIAFSCLIFFFYFSSILK